MPGIPLEPVDAVTITTLVENVYDTLMPDQGPARRAGHATISGRLAAPTMLHGSVPDLPVAEHGYSALLEVRREGRTHRLLFDLGISPKGMVENMRRLEVDPKDVEAVVCSHGHFDHIGGLAGLASQLGEANLPVIIHPDFWNRRRSAVPGSEPIEIPTTSRSALEGVGFEIVEDRQPSFLFDRSVLVTGEVPRVTGYEPGLPHQEAWRNDRWEPDPLVLDDQAIVLHVRGEGLVVITGCGHAGVVNIVRHARALTGVDRVCAVIGGFHLNGPVFEPLVGRVCSDLLDMHPSWVVPGHCTGWRALHALGRAFGDAFIPTAVGTRLTFEASAP